MLFWQNQVIWNNAIFALEAELNFQKCKGKASQDCIPEIAIDAMGKGKLLLEAEMQCQKLFMLRNELQGLQKGEIGLK